MRHAQLRAFHHVALTGGFSRAAEALHLTQPAISDQVRKLEADYDLLLFSRARKQAQLTEAGLKLFEITRRLFEIEAQAHEFLSQSSALRSGELRIIADSASHVLDILHRFASAWPDIRVIVSSGNSKEVLARLQAYEADIGVTGAPPDGAGFDALPLGAAPLIAFTGRDHPWARRGGVTLKALAGADLALRERGSKTRAHIEAAFKARGLTPRIRFEAEGREAVREIVAAGGGVGVVSQAEFPPDDRLCALPITDCDILMQEALICLAERRERRIVKAFFDIACAG